MKAFVIGATGYIGNQLFKEASRVFSTFGTSSAGSKNLLPCRLDAPNEFDYKNIKVDDIVFVTAAISAPDVCAREYDRAWAVNVTGTVEFISKVIERGARVAFFSSDAVYGEHLNPFDERMACSPAGQYGLMKYEVERLFEGNPLFKSMRLSYVFSREDKFTRYLVACSEKNEEAELFHPFSRSIIHRDDVVAGALSLAKRWGDVPEQIINFGGPETLSRVELAENLREASLNGLRFTVTEPEEAFFNNRPRVIAMCSPVLTRLLGRSPRRIREAALIEFNNPSTDKS